MSIAPNQTAVKPSPVTVKHDWPEEHVFGFDEAEHNLFGDFMLSGEMVVGAKYWPGSPGCMYLRNGDPGFPPEPDEWEWEVVAVRAVETCDEDDFYEDVELTDVGTAVLLSVLAEKFADDMHEMLSDETDWDDDGSDEKYDRWKDGEL